MSRAEVFTPELDPHKFEELLLYICERQITNRTFSLSKLNLLLCLSDMLHYRRYRTSISGAKYVRGEYGPWNVQLADQVASMEQDGRLTVVNQPVGDFLQRRPMALDSADLFDFNGAEIASVEQILRASDGQSANQMAELADDVFHWRELALGDPITYESAISMD